MNFKIYFFLVLLCAGLGCKKDKDTSFPGFQRFFETPLSYPGEIVSLQLADGAYLLATENKDGNIYILQLSKNGDRVLETTFGSEDPEEVKCLFKNASGNYIVAGTVRHSVATNSIFIWEFDEHLKLIKNYGNGGIPSFSRLIYISETNLPGTYLLVGETAFMDGKKVVSLETDFKNISTTKELFVQNYRESITSIFRTPTSELLWTGHFTDASFTNLSLLKSDLTCTPDWNLNYATYDEKNQEGVKSLITQSGEIITCGSNQSDATGTDFYIVKSHLAGRKIKEYVYERPSNQFPSSIMELNESILLTGFTEENGQRDILLIKTNSDLIITGQKIIGGTSSEEGKLLLPTLDGAFLLIAKVNMNETPKLAVYKILPEEIHF